MALGNKLPGGCSLPVNLRCGVTEGVQSDTLDIQEGESLNSTLSKVVKEVECLKDSGCDPCNSCGDTSTTTSTTSTEPVFLGNIQSTGSSSKRLTTSFPLEVVPSASSVSVNYNLSDAINSNGCTRTSSSVSIISGGNILNTSKSLIGVLTTTADKFPVEFKVNVTCSKDGKTEEISFNKTISASASNTDEFLTCTTLGSGTSLDGQSDVNEYLDTCVNEIKGRVTALEQVNYSGNTGIESISAALEQKITETQESIQNIDNSCDGVSICDLKATIDTQATQIQVLVDEIRRIDQQYKNLATLTRTS